MSAFSTSSFLSLFDAPVIQFDQHDQSNNQSNLFDLSCFYDEAAVQIPANAVNTSPLPLTSTSRSVSQSASQSNIQLAHHSKQSSGESPFLDLPALTSWMSNLFTEEVPNDEDDTNHEQSQESDQVTGTSVSQYVPSAQSLGKQPSRSIVTARSNQVRSRSSQPITSVKKQSTNSTSKQPVIQSLDRLFTQPPPASKPDQSRGRPVNRATNQSTNHARPHRSPVLWTRSVEQQKTHPHYQQSDQLSSNLATQENIHSISQLANQQANQSNSPSSKQQLTQSLNTRLQSALTASPSHSTSPSNPVLTDSDRPRRAIKPVLNVKCLSDSSTSISLSPGLAVEEKSVSMNFTVASSNDDHPAASYNVAASAVTVCPDTRNDAVADEADHVPSLSTSLLSVGTQMPSPPAHSAMTLIGSALHDANLDYFAADVASMIVVEHADEQRRGHHSDADSHDWEDFDEADEFEDIVDIDVLRTRQRGVVGQHRQHDMISSGDAEWTRVDEMSSSQSSEEFEIVEEQNLQ